MSAQNLKGRIGTIAGAAILAVLLWRLGTGAFLDGLRRIDGPTLLAALGIGLFTTVLSAWRWCVVARGLNIKLPLGGAVADYYRALFLNAALPGGVLGDVHRAVRHGQNTGDIGRGVRAVVLERTAGQIVLLVAGVTILLTLPSPVLAVTRDAVASPWPPSCSRRCAPSASRPPSAGAGSPQPPAGAGRSAPRSARHGPRCWPGGAGPRWWSRPSRYWRATSRCSSWRPAPPAPPRPSPNWRR